jgi:hypothetical protein
VKFSKFFLAIFCWIFFKILNPQKIRKAFVTTMPQQAVCQLHCGLAIYIKKVS